MWNACQDSTIVAVSFTNILVGRRAKVIPAVLADGGVFRCGVYYLRIAQSKQYSHESRIENYIVCCTISCSTCFSLSFQSKNPVHARRTSYAVNRLAASRSVPELRHASAI
jgi:hypothetical protein